MIDISPIVGGIIALVIGVVTTIFILIIRDRVCRCEKELKSVVKTELLKCFDRYIKADKEFKKEKIFSGIIILKALSDDLEEFDNYLISGFAYLCILCVLIFCWFLPSEFGYLDNGLFNFTILLSFMVVFVFLITKFQPIIAIWRLINDREYKGGQNITIALSKYYKNVAFDIKHFDAKLFED